MSTMTATTGPAAGSAPRHRDADVRRSVLRSLRPASGARGVLRAGVKLAAWTGVVLAVVVFAFLAVGPHVLGYRTATMLTGSMDPMIAPGDVVVSVPRPVTDVAVGDVISYHIPVEDRRVETHRVVEVSTNAAGQPVVRTKGDANPAPDSWTATLDGDTVWETVAVVPHLGSAIRTLRAPVVQHWVFYGGLAGLLLLGMGTIWRRGEDDIDDADDTEDSDPTSADAGGSDQALDPETARS